MDLSDVCEREPRDKYAPIMLVPGNVVTESHDDRVVTRLGLAARLRVIHGSR